MKPESRRNDVLTQEIGSELVVYDERTHQAHRLSPTAAVVYRAADGERSLNELAAAMRESLSALKAPGAATASEQSDALVSMALAELDRVGLLVSRLPALGEPMSRREMIGVTAALLPAIASIVAPTPAMAQTLPGVNPYGQFNGVYVGPGTPGEPNACGLGAGTTTITLETSFTIASMTIRHQGGTLFTITAVPVTPISPTQIQVSGSSLFTGGYQSTNTFTFTLVPPNGATVQGQQQISYPECGTTPYNITGTRQ